MGLNHADFMHLFDEWAPTYDQTVFARKPVDGFEDYERVLARVVQLADAGPGRAILDVGAGTGNLTAVVVSRGARAMAVEPSEAMREAAKAKLARVEVLEGQFLNLPVPSQSQDAVVSTYAFHHLTDEDKARGAREMLRVLKPGGRIVLGDIAWANEEGRQAMIRRFRAEGKPDLVQEIEEEYYPTIGLLTSVFAAEGCSVYVERMTDWVWVLVAHKPN